MIAEPQLLIDAPVKEKADRTPAWVQRADWSSNDALIAFWSAHPPASRDAFLKARAESYAANMWTQIRAQRAEQSQLWGARLTLFEEERRRIAELPLDGLTGHRHREIREECEARLLALRAKMRISRGVVRKCLKYLRAIQPKRTDHFTGVGKMINERVMNG